MTSVRWHRAWPPTSSPSTPTQVSLSVINGQVVVQEGQLLTADLPVVLEQHRDLARELARLAR